MSKLNIDQKNIELLFTERKPNFLIPDYQRPYAWGEEECQTLWDDIFDFAIPQGDATKFDSDHDEYFLGPIVTFKNERGQLEIIDGQQRLTTLMLLLRAFYKKFGHMLDDKSKKTAERLARCLWETDEIGTPDENKLEIDSEVATDDDKDEFLSILRTGVADSDMNSKYAKNFRFFEDKISDFINKYVNYFIYMPIRIMKNCILLPMEAGSQDTALRIFSTLNDRGLPLSDSDIFKAQLYKHFSDLNKKEEFVDRWKKLDQLCSEIFNPQSGIAMDEVFAKYMYYHRAKMNISSTTTEALRSFYEKDSYRLLKNESTLKDLEDIAEFWNNIYIQNTDVFSERVLRKLFVLKYAPNSMWTYFLSVYFMQNRDSSNNLPENSLYNFLNRTIAFIWRYSFSNPGLNSLRKPIFKEMINIVNDKEIKFSDPNYFTEYNKSSDFLSLIKNFSFMNNRPITKSILAWWMMEDDNQKLPSYDTIFEIEHIYPKNRQSNERGLSSEDKLESIGNKTFLEKRINIRASDYRFEDKKKYFIGFENNNGFKQGTIVNEIIDISNTRNDFNEKDIDKRRDLILESFVNYLEKNNFLKNSN